MTISAIISSQLALGQPPEAGWLPLKETNLLIIVGVTGVGKSSTVNALAAAGLAVALLPNRRELTDRFMITHLQRQDGGAITPISDRAARFEYTRRYRAQFPGGMGHTVAQLFIDRQALTAEWLIFDGLRGKNEVREAAAQLPNARFLLLDAPDFVRVQRLLQRNDAFDQITATQTMLSSTDLGHAAQLFSDTEIEALLAIVDRGEITLDELKGKLEIIRKERENYDPADTKKALLQAAPERTIYIDTSAKSVEEAAAFALEKFARTAK